MARSPTPRTASCPASGTRSARSVPLCPRVTSPVRSSGRRCTTPLRRWGWVSTPMRRSPPTAPTTPPAVGRSTASSTGSGRCSPICGPPVSDWRWPPPRRSRPRNAYWPISASTSTSRSSPEPASTARAPPRPTCSRMLWRNCSRCPNGCSWSATAATTSKARPPTASTRSSWAGVTVRPADFADTGATSGAVHVATIAELRRALGV